MEIQVKFLPFPFVCNYLHGELFYSWICRLHAINGVRDSAQTLKNIFGSGSIVPSADLPGGLGRLIAAMDQWGPFNSPERLACEATLFPYYTFFMAPDRKHEVLHRMIMANGSGLKAAMGLLANGFRASTVLKGCPTCDAQFLRNHGFKVLLRIHQLPCVDVCPIHGDLLDIYFMQSQQSDKQNLSYGRYKASRPANINLDVAHRFSALSMQTLQNEMLPLSNEARSDFYLKAITQLGICQGRRIDWMQLTQFVGNHYHWFDGMSCRDRLMSSKATPLRWLRDLCLRPQRNQHPICHILLAGALFGDVSSFVAAAKKQCETTASADRGSTSPSIAQQANYKPAVEVLIQDVSLSCRQVAIQASLSTRTIVLARKSRGIPVKTRPKFLRQPIVGEVDLLVKQRKSTAYIASSLNISLATVYRILNAYCMQIAKPASPLNKHRSRWEKQVAMHGSEGITAIRAKCKASYMWLYRHDRTWLGQHTPQRASNKGGRVRTVNWPTRDVQTAQLIRDIAAKTLSGIRKKRLSRTFLLRETNMESTIRKNLFKLPRVSQALDECSEDDIKFRERRRILAIKNLNDAGITNPPEWIIQARSGIRPRNKP